MIASLRHHRHRTGFRLWTIALALCWLSLSLAITCQRAMPQKAVAAMDACLDMAGMTADGTNSGQSPTGNCGDEPCFQALPDHGAQLLGVIPPLVVLLLPAVVLGSYARRHHRPGAFALPLGPPTSAIPLYYRFCSLRD